MNLQNLNEPWILAFFVAIIIIFAIVMLMQQRRIRMIKAKTRQDLQKSTDMIEAHNKETRDKVKTDDAKISYNEGWVAACKMLEEQARNRQQLSNQRSLDRINQE